MPRFTRYPIPHILGKISYPAGTRLRPDGDTVHLINPVLVIDGKAERPKDGKFVVWVTGSTKPKIIHVNGTGDRTYVPVRFEGIDAPEEHYRATAFKIKVRGREQSFALDPTAPHDERSQPLWSPATKYAVGILEAAGWGLAALDPEVTDRYGRVLGYVYASDSHARRKTFVSLELVKRGLAFPFLFESAGDRIPIFLAATRKAKAQKLGIWKHYQHRALPFSSTFSAPPTFRDVEPNAQQKARLSLPMAFRRTVDAHQLKGLSLKFALQKYDAMRFSTGDVLTGDQYSKIPIDDLIWAPHTFR